MTINGQQLRERTASVLDLEARYAREAFRDLSYRSALDLYAALWAEARALDPGIGSDWDEDLAADREVARAVNGLPPTA